MHVNNSFQSFLLKIVCLGRLLNILYHLLWKDLDKREKQLAANEQEVMRLKKDLQRDHDSKLQEMKEASRRMKEDSDHRVGLEK
jgi:F0F1-type ATP synthase membrane subunit b/b'